jgi:hypothetical protein
MFSKLGVYGQKTELARRKPMTQIGYAIKLEALQSSTRSLFGSTIDYIFPQTW